MGWPRQQGTEFGLGVALHRLQNRPLGSPGRRPVFLLPAVGGRGVPRPIHHTANNGQGDGLEYSTMGVLVTLIILPLFVIGIQLALDLDGALGMFGYSL